MPSLSNIEAIPTLWRVLHQIHDDWVREADKYNYSEVQRTQPNLDKSVFLMEALEEVKPRYIQYLFSYVNFFFTLENGFSVFYDELKALQAQLGLGLKISKKPKQPQNYSKLRRVRNYTVVHWGGPGKKHDINSHAGRMWGFSFKAEAVTLLDLRFGAISLVGADDRYLETIPEIHRACIGYLKQYDELCAELFERIVSHLPITVDNKEYVSTRPGSTSADNAS